MMVDEVGPEIVLRHRRRWSFNPVDGLDPAPDSRVVENISLQVLVLKPVDDQVVLVFRLTVDKADERILLSIRLQMGSNTLVELSGLVAPITFVQEALLENSPGTISRRGGVEPFLYYIPDAFADFCLGPIAIRLAQDRDITRQTLEVAEFYPFEITLPHNDRNDIRLAIIFAFKRSPHLYFMAIVGGEKVSADQQQYDVGPLDLFIDSIFPFLPRVDHPVMPGIDQPLTLHWLQNFTQLLP